MDIDPGIRLFHVDMAAGRSGDDQAGWPSVPAPPQGVAVFAADMTIRALVEPANTVGHWPEFDRGSLPGNGNTGPARR